MSGYEYVRTMRSLYNPRTPRAALVATEAGILPVEALIYKATSVKPLFEEPYDLDDLERVLAQGGLSSLRALGLFTPTGAATVLPLGLNSIMAGVGLTITGISIGSMMADAADEHDFLFGARREGLYFAGLGFAGKAATGMGALLAGLALDAIHFPKMAAVAGGAAQLSPAMLSNLTWATGPTAAAVSAAATCILFLYRIDRKRHAEISEALRRRTANGG